jgi:hypothetical protein
MRLPLVSAVVAGALAVMGGETRAQSTATGSATAKVSVLSPIAITTLGSLDFGDVVPGATSGTVVMAPGGTRAASGGGATLGTSAEGRAAIFTVTGASGYSYGVALPNSIVLASGTDTMTVDTFRSDPSGAGALTDGAQALGVGATLNVGANQVAGSYSGSFDVTVAYN